MTTGDALKRLEDSLKATNVLSSDYTSHVLGWAYKIAEVAHDAGRGLALEHSRQEVHDVLRKADEELLLIADDASEDIGTRIDSVRALLKNVFDNEKTPAP